MQTNTASAPASAPRRVVVLLSGIPGSGKSRHARALLERAAEYDAAGRSYANVVVVSADNYFLDEAGIYRFDVAKLGEAHGACMRAFLKAVGSEVRTVVVDNTNTTTLELAPYYAVARALGYEVEIVTVLCDPAVAAARNTHGVSLAGCVAMDARLRAREIPPYWEATLVWEGGPIS